MSTIYRWRSGTPSVTLTVSGIASDNSGVRSVSVSPATDIFSSNTVTKTSGGTANNTTDYKGTLTLKSLTASVSGSTTYEIASTTVIWNNGGSTTNTTKHSIIICEPATSVTLLANSSSSAYTIWSNASTNIPLSITINGANTPYSKTTGTAKFVSNNTSLVAVSSGTSYVTSTSASLPKNTSTSISQSTNVTLTAYTKSATTPSTDAAAATSFKDDITVTIKNAVKSVSLSCADTHIYRNGTVSISAVCVPHHTGTVYSTAMTASTSDANKVAISGNFSDTSNNESAITLTGKGGGIATITASYTATTNGLSGSVTKSITCSSLYSSQNIYTYVNGSGSLTVSYDSKSSESDANKVSASGSLSNSASGTFSYTGKATGTNTVTMASGAKIVFYCSSLNANTDVKVISSTSGGTTTSVTFSNDEVTSATTSSYFTYSPSTSSVSITAAASKSGTGYIYMRSGAKITVNVLGATVGDNDVRLNVGDSKTVTFDTIDSIKSATGKDTYYTYTTASGSVTITAKAAGSGTITLDSGMTISVTVSNISVSIS